jgi:hypothetical protein
VFGLVVCMLLVASTVTLPRSPLALAACVVVVVTFSGMEGTG